MLHFGIALAERAQCNLDLRRAIAEATNNSASHIPKTGLSVILKGSDARDLAALMSLAPPQGDLAAEPASALEWRVSAV